VELPGRQPGSGAIWSVRPGPRSSWRSSTGCGKAGTPTRSSATRRN